MQIYAIINIQKGGKDMQYKNVSVENIIARGELQNNLQAGKLQIFNGRASCKFSLYKQAAYMQAANPQHAKKLQPRAVKRR